MKRQSFSATLLVSLFVLSLVLSPFSGVFAANGTNITTPWNNDNNQFPSQTTTAGQLKVVDLEPNFSAFTDSLNRTLTYSVSGSNIGPHTHVERDSSNNNHLTLYFTVQNAGDYTVTVIAEYKDINDVVIDSASFDISIHVDSAAPASSAQIDYDEDDVYDDITVYVTVSNDGMPIKGQDGTVLASYPVTLPYFDLADYGLQDYYRYPAEGGSTVIQRPTMLHLYIYLLERYYMGRPESSCGGGIDNYYNVFTYTTQNAVEYMDDSTAYYPGSNYALAVSGGAGSLYLTSFWGHDQNLMYFRNHVFPLMSAGWGATADYILLSDGDYIDIAMFSNWDFYSTGAFLCFNSDAFVAQTGHPLSFTAMQYSASAYFGTPVSLVAMTDELDVDIYCSNWTKLNTSPVFDSNNYSYSYTFTTAGTYYIVAKGPNAKSSLACYAPAVAVVTVN